MKIIEISGRIENGMWDYGEPFPKASIEEIAKIEKDGFCAHKFTFSILTGTYLETGAHLLPGVRMLDEVKIEEMVREAVVIKVPMKNEGEHVTREDLEENSPLIKENDALLVCTGWDRMWNKENFVKGSPHFTSEAMDWLISKKITLLGGDVPCYDDPKDPEDSKNLPLLRRYYETGGLILAPVVNLGKVTASRVKLMVFPLPVKGVCAAPCRAILEEK